MYVDTSMKVLAALVAVHIHAAAGCNNIINSISYCNAVESITYENIGFDGSYNRITSMDNETCKCISTPHPFSGPMAPLDSGLSIHFRGPLSLKQFAVYMPEYSNKKKRDAHIHRHAARHAKFRRGIGRRDLVTVTDTVVETDFYDPTTVHVDESATTVIAAGAADATFSAMAAGGAGGAQKGVKQETAAYSASSSTRVFSNVMGSESPSSSSSSAKSPASSGSSNYKRAGFYNSKEGIAHNITMLGNYGGQGSGTFDFCFGNSLSYINAMGNAGSATPQVLEDITIPSVKEFSIWTDMPCDTEHCGFYRENVPSFRGFEGKDKIFMFEFSMPKDMSGGDGANMPAIWALNVEIPLATQYGPTECSCWTSGCGEFDMFEVLKDAEDYIKTHYHSDQGTNTQYGGGGSPDYFARPYDKTIKTAVVFASKNIHITVLDDDTNFDEMLDQAVLDKCTDTMSTSAFLIPS